MNCGIVIGRFMPLHDGHIALIRTAQALVDHLTVIICCETGDLISGEQRLSWLIETFPSLRIVTVPLPAPRHFD